MDTQDEPSHFNAKEIETINNNLEKEKAPASGSFTSAFYQTFKEGIMPLLYNHFQKIEMKGILPN